MTALKVVLDDEGFRRRVEIARVPGPHEQGVYHRFYEASYYLREWCRFEMYATEIEPLLGGTFPRQGLQFDNHRSCAIFVRVSFNVHPFNGSSRGKVGERRGNMSKQVKSIKDFLIFPVG